MPAMPTDNPVLHIQMLETVFGPGSFVQSPEGLVSRKGASAGDAAVFNLLLDSKCIAGGYVQGNIAAGEASRMEVTGVHPAGLFSHAKELNSPDRTIRLENTAHALRQLTKLAWQVDKAGITLAPNAVDSFTPAACAALMGQLRTIEEQQPGSVAFKLEPGLRITEVSPQAAHMIRQMAPEENLISGPAGFVISSLKHKGARPGDSFPFVIGNRTSPSAPRVG